MNVFNFLLNLLAAALAIMVIFLFMLAMLHLTCDWELLQCYRLEL